MTLSRRILTICVLSLCTIGLWAQETGKADVFSDEFQGSWTASKTTYNKNEFVAAHKSYEFGTILKVMLDGGDKAINVRVVDRGPFKFGYVTTLSRAAANELGLKDDDERSVTIFVAKEQGLSTVAPATMTIPAAGTTTIAQAGTVATTTATAPQTIVNTTTITPTTPEFASKGQPTNIEVGTAYKTVVTTTAAPTTTVVTAAPATTIVTAAPTSTAIMSSTVGYGLQVGSFADYNNAVKEMTALKNNNIHNLLINTVNEKSGKVSYKLIVGPYADRTEVEQYKVIAPGRLNTQSFIVDLSKVK